MHGGMEGEIRERTVKRICHRKLKRIMRVKRDVRNITIPTLTYVIDMDRYNTAQQSIISAVENNYTRGICGLSK